MATLNNQSESKKRSLGLFSPPVSQYSEGSSVIQIEKSRRLKINRVAIVQELKVEHVLPYLLEHQVLTIEEHEAILEGPTQHDRTRLLIDILPQKGRSLDWYGHFRQALRQPDTNSNEVKQKYQILIEFMDNTIINQPESPRSSVVSTVDSNVSMKKLPHYEPLPGINNGNHGNNDGQEVTSSSTKSHGTDESGEEKGMAESNIPESQYKDNGAETESQSQPQQPVPMTLVKGYIHKWVPNPTSYASLIEAPEDHFKSLRDSSDPADQHQLQQEESVLQKMKDFEILYVLNKRQQLPEGFEFSMSGIVDELLSEPTNYHLYFKYFHKLKTRHSVDVMMDLVASFVKFVESLPNANDGDLRHQIVRTGFNLFGLLTDHGAYYRGEQVLVTVIVYLTSYQAIETWMAVWEACIKIMGISITNLDFNKANVMYNSAQGMTHRINMLSFGKDLLDESQMFTELSRLMREQGSIGPTHGWAMDAMKEVDLDNSRGIVDAMCCATVAYTMKWNVKKAEQLAVETVKQAKKLFTTNHPMYIQALLNYNYYSNEFRQDSFGVQVAQAAVKICEKVYGDTPSIVTAQTHENLAKALVVAQQFDGEQYMEHALKAHSIAMDTVDGSHPRLAVFRYTMAQCLQWKAQQSLGEERHGALVWAESEARGALRVFKSAWGEYSLKTAQGYSLLGQIYAKMEKWDDAEQMLMSSYSVCRLGLPAKSHYLYLSKATLGAFYRSVNRPAEAMDLLKEVVEDIDCGGIYLRWVHMCYDTLIELLKATDQHKEAEKYQAALTDWARKNPKLERPITFAHLHADAEPFEEFLQDFTKMAQKFKSARRGVLNLGFNMENQ